MIRQGLRKRLQPPGRFDQGSKIIPQGLSILRGPRKRSLQLFHASVRIMIRVVAEALMFRGEGEGEGGRVRDFAAALVAGSPYFTVVPRRTLHPDGADSKVWLLE